MSDDKSGTPLGLFILIGLIFVGLLFWASLVDKEVRELRDRVEVLEGKP